MNEETTPTPDSDDLTGHEHDFDAAIADALRAEPSDMDELFARRAIDTAMNATVTAIGISDQVAADKNRSGVPPRTRWVPMTAAAAVVAVLAAVGILTLSSQQRGSSVATMSQDAAGLDSAEMMTDAPNSDMSMAPADPLAFLGEFDDVDDLVAATITTDGDDSSSGSSDPWDSGTDSPMAGTGTESARGSDGSTSTGPGRSSDGDDRGAAGETAGEDPHRLDGHQLEHQIEICSAQLRSQGRSVTGWAILGTQTVVVVAGDDLAAPMVFDAVTCTT